MQALWPLVELRDAGGLAVVREEPTVLVLWHAGVPMVEIPAIAKLGVSAIVPEPAHRCEPVSNIRFYDIHGDQEGRLLFLKRGLEHLRKGVGPVLFFLDRPVGHSGTEVDFLGARLRVGKGAASLARMSGARVVPVTTSWVAGATGRVEVSFHAPLPEPDVPRKARADYESAILAGAAAWFENYLREHPERLRVRFAKLWLERTRAETSEDDRSNEAPGENRASSRH